MLRHHNKDNGVDEHEEMEDASFSFNEFLRQKQAYHEVLL